ncbi:TPA: hypothetical protein R5R89_001869 [Salmonella enterica]|nr:hypothetical protein [Salmonella enterica]
MRLAFFTIFLSFSSFASDTVPLHQDKAFSVIRTLSSNSNADILASSGFDACNVHFKDYIFPSLTNDEYYRKKYPVSEWICLYSGEAFEAGYDTQQINNNGANESSTENKIVYDYKNKIWKSVPDKNYKKNGEINELKLIKIEGENSNGYMAINSMKKLKDGRIGEGFYFCLIHNNNALCGSGENVKSNSALTSSQDALKLLNSILFDDN